LCDNALLTGYALGRKEIDARIMREVAEELNLTTGLEARLRPINNLNGYGAAPASGVALAEAQSRTATRLEPKATNVKPVRKSIPSTAFVPPSFLNALTTALTDAVGPMAKIVLRDQIKTLGESPEQFPHAKVDRLLELLESEISGEGMRTQFRSQVVEQVMN